MKILIFITQFFILSYVVYSQSHESLIGSDELSDSNFSLSNPDSLIDTPCTR